jgi:hypothetical protein
MAFALSGMSSLAAAAVAVVYLAGVVAVQTKIWLNKINPPLKLLPLRLLHPFGA